jgi:hypothetical protein
MFSNYCENGIVGLNNLALINYTQIGREIEGKREFERPRHRWGDYIRIYLK